MPLGKHNQYLVVLLSQTRRKKFLGGNYEDYCHIQLLQSLAVLSFPPGLRDESLNIRQRMVTRTCMNVCVFLHVRLLMEPLAAVLARVWPRVRMDEEVCWQGGASFESFATLFAGKYSFITVNGSESESRKWNLCPKKTMAIANPYQLVIAIVHFIHDCLVTQWLDFYCHSNHEVDFDPMCWHTHFQKS